MKNSVKLTVILCLLHGMIFGQLEDLNITKKLWGPTGTHPQEYEMGGNPFDKKNQDIAFIKSKNDLAQGFAGYATSLATKDFPDTRIKLSCDLKLIDVANQASVWMRVDGKDNSVLGFDNLQTRPPAKDIDGWQHHYIVLDIPDESSRLLFGLLLAGKGELYVKNMALEAVDNSTQTTNMLK
jgi:hypothetical protein